jgi:hypothetical protein
MGIARIVASFDLAPYCSSGSILLEGVSFRRSSSSLSSAGVLESAADTHFERPVRLDGRGA